MDASQLIDEKIAGLGGWRGEMYARLRKLINEADPNIKRRLEMEHRSLEPQSYLFKCVK